MGTSEEPTRSRIALIWLLGVVVAVGAVSLAISLGIGHNVRSPTISPSPVPTPTPLNCPTDQMQLVGVINECATAAPDKTSTCSVAGDTLDASLPFAGSDQAILLYIEVKGFYNGPGTYYLPPWQFGLGRNDVPKVAVLQSTTGVFWESVAGTVTVTGSDGRSGNVSAILQASSASRQASDGSTVVPGPTLSVDGPWRCGATAIPTSIPAPTATATMAPPDLSGTWTGLCTGPFDGFCSLTWTQTANALDGTFMLPRQSVHISGNVTGSTISFRAVGIVTFTGTLSGATISGSYTDIANGKTGTWSVTLSP